jgi:plastocyanin
MRRVAVLLLLSLLVRAPLPAHTGELHGTLQLLQDGKAVRDGVDQAVVYFTPAKPTKVEALDEPVEMATVKKDFRPRALVVPVGSRVRFPNLDPILHNAFSVSGANAFDVGIYSKGPGKEITFKEPGLVRVFCNVHQSMAGFVLVVDTPFWTQPDAAGRFSLVGLPAGNGTLSIWHERGELKTQPVTVPVSGALTLSLPVTRPRIPLHLNKLGQPYRTDSSYR